MFAALVAATVAAIFLTQHLKVSLPLIQGYPNPVPAAFNPVAGRVCKTRSGQVIDYSKTWISFTLASSDTVDAYIFNSAGRLVNTVRTGQPIQAQVRSPRFYWDGRQSNGEYAPAGTYYWRFVLERENRTIALTNKPIKVITTEPHPAVTSVRLTGGSATAGRGGGPGQQPGPAIITPKKQSATINFTKADYQQAMIMLWRTNVRRARLATEWPVDPAHGVAQWNGWIHHRLAPAGTYLIGVQVQDEACNQGTFPVAQPPVTPEPGTGVTVRYLAAQPPLEPVPAGSRATVYVDSRLQRYRWSLRAAGAGRPISHGAGGRNAYRLHVRLPARTAGLYVLTIRSGSHTTRVPLVADATAGAAAHARVLVVLPMLTWQGENPVDDTGGGFPVTLTGGERVQLKRPLVDGLPRGFGEQASLLRYLTARDLSFQLTTDVALAQGAGAGPSLSGHRGVILAGAFNWLPSQLVPKLRTYAQEGGGSFRSAPGRCRRRHRWSRPGPRSPLDPLRRSRPTRSARNTARCRQPPAS